MRTLAAVIVVTLAGPLAGAAEARAVRSTARPTAAHLLVYAQEWSLWPSRSTLPAGTIDVELWNRGQDSHDVRVRALKHGTMTGPVLAGVKVTASGAISTAVWHLRAGRYELYCSMPGHLAMGMHTTITVNKGGQPG